MLKEGWKHVEAFCFMEYTCEKCDKTEIIWNSRDGVTPFCVNCINCDGTMQHSNWHKDIRFVSYTLDHLSEGQRYFCDLTRELYIENIKNLIKKYRNDESNEMYNHIIHWLMMIENLEKDETYFDKITHEGEPTVRVYKKGDKEDE